MVLRKLSRNAAMESIDLFRRLDLPNADHPIDSTARIEAVVDSVRSSLEAALSTPSTLRGWRAQALFASLVVALDSCELMTFVDAGEIHFDGPSVKAPDFHLVLRDGRRILVDVKSVNPNFSSELEEAVRFSASEIDRLQRFASLYGAELFIAVYLEGFPMWCLVAVGDLSRGAGGSYRLSIKEAVIRSQLGLLGDLSVGTVYPLELRATPVPGATNQVIDGRAQFQIDGLEMWAGGKQIVSAPERKILWFLMQFGGWENTEDLKLAGDKVVQVVWSWDPIEPDELENWAYVNSLATMYSRKFEGLTTSPDGISALDTPTEPGAMASLIPAGYESKELPLWIFHLRPSEDRSTL